MKKEKICLKWAVVIIVLLLSITSIKFNVVGNDPANFTYEEYIEYLRTLPYFLNGTILDGTYRVIVNENGTPPDDITPEEYDYFISVQDFNNTCETARQQFRGTYGIDPYPPEFYENVTEDMAYDEWQNIQHYNQSPSGSPGPHEIDGNFLVKVFPAKDSTNRPFNPQQRYQDTKSGCFWFLIWYGVYPEYLYYYGFWDASDVTPSSGNFLQDLYDDCKQYRKKDNQILFGWVYDGPNAGNSWRQDFYAVAEEWNFFSHKRVAQHEVSHCFNAPDHGWWLSFPCVMSYWWMWFGWFGWCGGCRNIVWDQIWNWN